MILTGSNDGRDLLLDSRHSGEIAAPQGLCCHAGYQQVIQPDRALKGVLAALGVL